MRLRNIPGYTLLLNRSIAVQRTMDRIVVAAFCISELARAGTEKLRAVHGLVEQQLIPKTI